MAVKSSVNENISKQFPCLMNMHLGGKEYNENVQTVLVAQLSNGKYRATALTGDDIGNSWDTQLSLKEYSHLHSGYSVTLTNA